MPVNWVRSITTENNFNYRVRRHSKGENFEKTIFENNFPVSVSTITKSEECLLFYSFVCSFVCFFSVLSSVHIRTYARAYSWNFEKYVFFYFPENIVCIKWEWLINFSQLTAAFSFVFIYWKIPAENVGNGISETGPKLKNFLGNMVLDSPSLERLLHSYFSFRASAPKSHATPKVFDRCY